MHFKNHWNSIGLIFKPNKKLYWMKSHCWVPFVEIVNKNLVKVFFSSRDKNNLSRTGHFFLNPERPFDKKKVGKLPDVDLGKLGTFDDSAAVSTCIVNFKGRKYLYYVGWMQGKRVRYYPTIGLSVCKKGETKFKKNSIAPLISKNTSEPYGLASPFVLYDRKEKIWKMWYSSYRSWQIRRKIPYPNYEIRFASSQNGIDWKFKNKKILGSKKIEAVARPFVIKENNLYRMWFCSRKKNSKYKINYAESKNGYSWKNKAFKLKLSREKYDNKMQAYPCYFKFKGKEYLLYNGNDYGKDGILMAVKER